MDVITKETNHLGPGSSNPPKENGVLRVYSMNLCPFAERARLVLLVKKLRHEIVNIDLKKKPDWYLELNPQGKVPALDIGSEILVESLDVCDYLDETYPEPMLYPTDVDAKNRDKILIKKMDAIITLYYKTQSDFATPFSEYVEKLLPLLEEYEQELIARGDYFGGKEPGMVDYMVWPWAERAEVLDLARGEKIPIPEGKLNSIRAWCDRMKKLDVIKNTIVSKERAYKLFQLYQAGGPVDYDSI